MGTQSRHDMAPIAASAICLRVPTYPLACVTNALEPGCRQLHRRSFTNLWRGVSSRTYSSRTHDLRHPKIRKPFDLSETWRTHKSLAAARTCKCNIILKHAPTSTKNVCSHSLWSPSGHISNEELIRRIDGARAGKFGRTIHPRVSN